MSLTMSDYTHVVLVMKDHYPSIFLYESEDEAKLKYNELELDEFDCDDRAIFIGEIKNFKGLFWKDQVDWD